MTQEFTKAGFVRSYVVPALLMFALPLAGYAFARYAIGSSDAMYLEQLVQSVERASDLPTERRQELLTFYRENVVSALCAAGDEGRKALPTRAASRICGDYEQLGWIAEASLGCMLLGALSVIVVLVCAAIAFTSRAAQYASFIVGWNFLRLASVFQVLVQGFIGVMLSYWLTAFFFDFYAIKLIAVVGLLALGAAFVLVKAIFTRPNDTLAVEGAPLVRAKSPSLWARIEGLCKRIGTTPPDHIVGGIDDNFFVTEHPVHLASSTLKGRTLFVSLSLLKRLDKAEADAVLAHEMAHFSGGDTRFSKKLSPLLSRYQTYMAALYAGALSRPIYYFMLFYRSLLQLSIGRDSRSRELRADRIAAKVTSPELIANALFKVAAYSSYRARVEQGLFAGTRAHANLDISERVAVGFTDYARGPRLGEDLGARAFPHPFDSHPPLAERLHALRIKVSKQDILGRVVATANDTWFSEIGDAAAIERALWDAYEARFRTAHEQSLAYRYLPSTPEERAHVERFFPSRNVPGKKAGTSALVIDCEKLRYVDWPRAVAWAAVEKIIAKDEPFRGRILTFKMVGGGNRQTLKLPLRKLGIKPNEAAALIQQYFARYLTARANTARTGATVQATTAGRAA